MTEIKIGSCVLAEVEGDKEYGIWCPFFHGNGAFCKYHKDGRGHYGKKIPPEVVNGAETGKPDWCQVNKITVHTNV